jgi:hypothetical protein
MALLTRFPDRTSQKVPQPRKPASPRTSAEPPQHERHSDAPPTKDPATRNRAWEIRAQSAIDEMRDMTRCDALGRGARSQNGQRTLATISRQLTTAEEHLNRRPSPGTWLRGTRLEGAWGHIHNARVLAVEVLDDDQLVAYAPRVLALADKYLRHGVKSDPEPTLQAIKPWYGLLDGTDTRAVSARRTGPPNNGSRAAKNTRSQRHNHPPGSTRRTCAPIAQCDRYALAAALRECYDRVGNEYHRLRRFQAVMVVTTILILLLVAGLIFAGWNWPRIVPLCFPDPTAAVAQPAVGSTVCPTGQQAIPSSADVAVVVLFGLLGAALAGVRLVVRPAAASLVPMGATRWFQVLLKAATGMLTAVLGLLFLRAEVVPGFSQVDTQAQILVYAIIFGASQELITKFVDQRSNDLLDAVTTSEQAADHPAKSTTRSVREDRTRG